MIPNPLTNLIATPTLPALGPERRADALPLSEIQLEIDQALKSCGIEDRQNLIRSAILLWHDHLDASHTLSQAIKTSDGSYLHALMHRREPDYPNAKYWLRQTGPHPAFAAIATEAQAHLKTLSLPEFNPFTLVDQVSQAQPDTPQYTHLQQIQKIELETLIEQFCG